MREFGKAGGCQQKVPGWDVRELAVRKGVVFYSENRQPDSKNLEQIWKFDSGGSDYLK